MTNKVSDNKAYKLKVDVLWYKAGTIFEYKDSIIGRQLYITKPNSEPIATLDNLQNAIAGHMTDEDGGEYFEEVEL